MIKKKMCKKRVVCQSLSPAQIVVVMMTPGAGAEASAQLGAGRQTVGGSGCSAPRPGN